MGLAAAIQVTDVDVLTGFDPAATHDEQPQSETTLRAEWEDIAADKRGGPIVVVLLVSVVGGGAMWGMMVYALLAL